MAPLFFAYNFETSFRLFLTMFKLPLEGQQVTRIAQAFAKGYVTHNSSGNAIHEKLIIKIVIKDPDTAFLLACGVLMLNTDAHNSKV